MPSPPAWIDWIQGDFANSDALDGLTASLPPISTEVDFANSEALNVTIIADAPISTEVDLANSTAFEVTVDLVFP